MKLENLFKWQSSFEVKDENGKVVMDGDKPLTLYQRVVGDAELSEARKNALYASRKLRKELKNEASRDHAILLPDYEDMNKQELQNAIILTDSTQLRRRAEEQADLPKYPTKPKDDSLEAQEEYQVAIDEYDDKRKEAIDKEVENLIKQRQESLKELTKDELQDLFIESVIRTMARSRMLEEFNKWCAYFGTYEDKAMNRRAFKSFETFDNAAPELKRQILDNYIDLEFSGGELKKSQSATSSEASGSSQES